MRMWDEEMLKSPGGAAGSLVGVERKSTGQICSVCLNVTLYKWVELERRQFWSIGFFSLCLKSDVRLKNQRLKKLK